MEVEENISVQSRFSDAPWAKNAEDKHIIIGGVGGIGSWTTLFLSSIGYTLHLFDFDIIEKHNLGGQFYNLNQLGLKKTEAIIESVKSFRESENIFTYEKYDKDSMISPIMVSCFDNMEARKSMFENWKAQEDRVAFIDGRMQAEIGMYYCVLPGQEEMYEKELFEDSDVEELNCNYKATTHCGAFIGSQLTSLITNVIYNKEFEASIRATPFKTEFEMPMLNIQTINYDSSNK